MPPAHPTGPTIADGGLLPQSDTVSEVDLDQLFNTFDRRPSTTSRR